MNNFANFVYAVSSKPLAHFTKFRLKFGLKNQGPSAIWL